MNLQIEKPTLLLDEAKARRNIATMAQKAARSGVRFRPHFKTHQSAGIGEWFREAGVSAITVSSVDMARYFADHGWQDITIAFSVNWLEIDKINRLAEEINLHLLVESSETVLFLHKKLQHPVNVWLKIDVGYGRTGIPWNNQSLPIEIAKAIDSSPNLTLRGLLTHAGHTYGAGAGTRQKKEAIHYQVLSRLQHVQDALTSAGWPALEISIGDTPSCTVVDDLSGADEIRPGNFVFYDIMQHHAGVCSAEEIAVALACPVVAKHPSRGQIVIYGGAVHLSKEYITRADGRKSYGAITLPTETGWGAPLENTFIASLSQEHGLVQVDDHLMNRIQIGDILLVLPIHSCLTANLRRQYLTLNGEIIQMTEIL